MSKLLNSIRSHSDVSDSGGSDSFSENDPFARVKSIKYVKWTLDDFIEWIKTLDFFSEKDTLALSDMANELGLNGKRLASLSKNKTSLTFCKKKGYNEIHKFLEESEDVKNANYTLNTFSLFFEKMKKIEMHRKTFHQWFVVRKKMIKLLENKFPYHKKSVESLDSITEINKLSDSISEYDLFHLRFFAPFVKVMGIREDYDEIYQEYKDKVRKLPDKDTSKKGLLKNLKKSFLEKYEEKITKFKTKFSTFKKEYEDKTGSSLSDNYFKLVPSAVLEESDLKIKQKGLDAFNKSISNKAEIWGLGSGYHRLEVKLVIKEISSESVREKFDWEIMKSYLSPRLKKKFFEFPKLRKKLNNVNFSVIVGPWYLSFSNDSKLCVPRSIVSADCYKEIDIKSLSLKHFLRKDFSLKKIAKKLSKVCHKFNTQMRKGKDVGMAQMFVDEILKELEVYPKSMSMEKIFTCIREGGSKNLAWFEPSEEFLKYFHLKSWKKKFFKTHENLDKFVNNLNDIAAKDTNRLDQIFPAECSFLKTIDRMFWLRYFKFKSAAFKPLGYTIGRDRNSSAFTHSCPFDNPFKFHAIQGSTREESLWCD